MTRATDDFYAAYNCLKARERAGEHVLPGNTEMLTWRPSDADLAAAHDQLEANVGVTVRHCNERRAA